jgi:hypothetical protein
MALCRKVISPLQGVINTNRPLKKLAGRRDLPASHEWLVGISMGYSLCQVRVRWMRLSLRPGRSVRSHSSKITRLATKTFLIFDCGRSTIICSDIAFDVTVGVIIHSAGI